MEFVSGYVVVEIAMTTVDKSSGIAAGIALRFIWLSRALPPLHHSVWMLSTVVSE